MSGLVNYFNSYFTSKNDYDTSLNAVTPIEPPLRGDDATNVVVAATTGTTTTATAATTAPLLPPNDKIDNVVGSKSLLHTNADTVDKYNHRHVNVNNVDESSSLLHNTTTTAPMATISKNTIPSPEEQRNIDISTLEFFLTRRMMNGYNSDFESASDAHNSECTSDDEQQPAQHHPSTIAVTNSMGRRHDTTASSDEKNDDAEYFDAMTTPETQPPPDDTAVMHQEDSEYQQTYTNDVSLLETQPLPATTAAVEEFTQDMEEKDIHDVGTQNQMLPPLQTQPDYYPTTTWQASPTAATTPIATTDSISETPRAAKISKPKKKRKKIPHIAETTEKSSSIHNLNLRCKSLSLELAQVRLIWSTRQLRYLRPRKKGRRQSSSSGEEEDVLARKRDDGPLAYGFNSVLCMELMEMEDSDHINDEVGDERTKIIRQTATRAFGNTVSATSRTTALEKEGTKTKKRRIRLFLYNDYADQMQHLLNEMESRKMKEKKLLQDKFVVSLRNIPAQCIFPFNDFPVEESKTGLLNDTYGRLSQLCICIGGKSRMKTILNDANIFFTL